MENASKALLIAGSILIAILLIAAGVSVYTSTQGTTDSVKTTMNATEIATFNGKFTSYVGNNKSYAQVRSLLNLVAATNSTSSREVWVTLKKIDGSFGNYLLPKDSVNVDSILISKTNSTFRITINSKGYDSDGFIKYIMINY